MRSIVPHSIHSLKEKNILLLTCVSLLIVILFGGRIVGDWDGGFDTWHENHETARTINYGQEFVENPFQKCVDSDYLGDKWMMEHSSIFSLASHQWVCLPCLLRLQGRFHRCRIQQSHSPIRSGHVSLCRHHELN